MIQVAILAAVLGLATSASPYNGYLPPNTASFPTGVGLRQASASSTASAFPTGVSLGQASASSSASAFPTGVALGQASASSSASTLPAAQGYSFNNVNQGGSSKFVTENDGQGAYRFHYETASSSAEEQGDARGDGTKARGSYSYSLPNGERVTLTYTADENGFVAQGSHIPTPPPIPEAILKALEENAAAEARGIFDDGSYHGEGEEEGQYHGEGEEGNGFSQSNVISSAKAVASNSGYKY